MLRTEPTLANTNDMILGTCIPIVGRATIGDMGGASLQSADNARPVSLFFCYSHKDQELQQELETHLSTLHKSGALSSWSYRQIAGGQDWRTEIDTHLSQADIILLLLSANFFASDHCYEVEAKRALERHDAGQARVIPIVLTAAADWLSTPIGKLQALPAGATPITSWPDRHSAWAIVVEGIKKAIAEIVSRPVKPRSVCPAPFLVPSLKGMVSLNRLEILESLHGIFCNSLSPPAVQCLYGLRGTGKRHLAISYAHHYRQEYRATFLIDANREIALREGFFAIAQVLGLSRKDPQSLDEGVLVAQRWLTENAGWLLILAGAETPEIVRPFIPMGAAGHILITAEHDFRDLGVDRSLLLGELQPNDALNFLRQRTGYKLVNEEELAAVELAKELGYLPLALEQAAAFLVKRRMPISVHLKSLQQRPAEILGKYRTCIGTYKESVATTWSLIFNKLEEESPASMDLLRLSALLDGSGVPLDFFYRENGMLRSVMAELGPSFQNTHHVDQLFDLLEPLASYSLIHVDPDGGYYSINRLVQQAVRLRMDDANQRLWAERTVRAVGQAILGLRYEDWPAHQYLSRQVKAAADLIEPWGLSFPAAVALLNKRGHFLHELGRHSDAEHRYQVALGICDETVGNRSAEISDTLNGLGRLCFRRGRYREAEEYFSRALSIRREVYGDAHCDVAASENNLALLRFTVNPTDALIEQLYEHALQVRGAKLGPDHPLLARTVKNLGVFRTFHRQYGEAERLHHRGLDMFARTLGREHPIIAHSLNDLGQLCLCRGEYIDAERYYRRAQAIGEEAYGTEHPDTAYSIQGLARVYAAQRQDCEAEGLFLEALRRQETHLGSEHPHVAGILFGLAVLRDRAGNRSAAELLYQRVLRIWGRSLAPMHPDYVDCHGRLAALLGRPGHPRPLPEVAHSAA